MSGTVSSGGMTISYPMMALAGTVMLSVVIGSIQLGAVQTHVEVNTVRLDKADERERAHLRAIAVLEATISTKVTSTEERLRALEEIARRK